MSLFVFATKDKYIRLTLLLLNENNFMVLLHSFGAKLPSFPLLFEQEQLGYLKKFSFCVPQMKEQSFIFSFNYFYFCFTRNTCTHPAFISQFS